MKCGHRLVDRHFGRWNTRRSDLPEEKQGERSQFCAEAFLRGSVQRVLDLQF